MHALSVLSLAGAFWASLYFRGLHLTYFALTFALLALWLGAALWLAAGGFRIRVTALFVTLGVFCLWLFVTLIWTRTIAVSSLNAWWISTVGLTYLGYRLTERGQRFWPQIGAVMVASGVGLCVYAVLQLTLWHRQPQAMFLDVNSFAALLNLMSLPLAGYLVARPSRRLWPLWVALFVLVFTMVLTRGRGAFVGFVLGFSVLMLLAHRDGRRTGLLLAVVAVAFLAAQAPLHGGAFSRLGTLTNPVSAGATRFAIWAGAWHLFLQAPLRGIGLGAFFLAYPRYRLAADTSAGFYAHNDYLQIAIEAGVVGLILLVTVLLVATRTFVRTWRTQKKKSAARAEAAGLFAGLLAVAVHSLVSFNLYIMPITLLAGIIMGRLDELGSEGRTFTFAPHRLFSANGLRTIVVLLVAGALLAAGVLGLSRWSYRQAFKDAAEGRLAAANHALSRAERLCPDFSTFWFTNADLLRQAARKLPLDSPVRVRLVHAALADLARARHLDPWRPQTFLVRAALLWEQRALLGGGSEKAAMTAIHEALARDPRYYPARIFGARILIDSGRWKTARRLLNAGLGLWYPVNPGAARYRQWAQAVARHRLPQARDGWRATTLSSTAPLPEALS